MSFWVCAVFIPLLFCVLLRKATSVHIEEILVTKSLIGVMDEFWTLNAA